MAAFNELSFAHPWMLFVLPLVVLAAGLWWYWRWRKYNPSWRFSSISAVVAMGNKGRAQWRLALPVLRVLAIALMVVALARPQSMFNEEEITTEGIDIVLVTDISSSMMAEDFKQNRLDAAKRVANEFIEGRPNDRMGLVIFANESFTQCPITTDHAVLKDQLKKIRKGLLKDGTAIGMGLATAVTRLKDSDAKSKVVILLTDGENNAGTIDPLTATDIALQFGVRVYTVGIGTKGQAPFPAKDAFGRTVKTYVDVNIDEELLGEIAQQTGGRYFRATNDRTLVSIFEEIDQLEKSKINVSAFTRKTERFYPWALAALALLFVERVLRLTVFRSLT